VDRYNVDVLIIGAGAIGTAVARELSKLKQTVLVVDRLNDVGGDASKSNSAIVHTGFDAPPGSLESQMVVHSNPMFAKLCSTLDIPFRQSGAILVAVSEQEDAELHDILEKAQQNHVYDVEPLSAKEVLDLEPAVSAEVKRGILVPREGIVDPFLLVIAQAENAAANGVEFLTDGEIAGLTRRRDGFAAESSKGVIKSKYVVNAAGLYTDKISSFFGINDFKVHPRRGQFHVVDRAAPLGINHIILPVPTKITKGKLLAPTVHGNWLIGPTAEELDDKSAHQTTTAGLQEVVTSVQRLVPSLDPGSVITQYAGLRPVREPGGYHIRRFDDIPGYLELSGIRSTGISASLAVAVVAKKMLIEMGMAADRKSTTTKKREGIPCFRDADALARERLIRHDPGYGHVICRCETVTEAEVAQAIRRTPGARDIDGIKRRIRAGLGRCQAGFCGMRIPQIIARELGIPLEEVTKKGKGSEILAGPTKMMRTHRHEDY
jgi:glycerol-3-phosphate dehydrogenase